MNNKTAITQAVALARNKNHQAILMVRLGFVLLAKIERLGARKQMAYARQLKDNAGWMGNE